MKAALFTLFAPGYIQDTVVPRLWLQERGYIQPDEFNGTQFVCVIDDTIVTSERNPVTIDIRAKLRSDAAIDVSDIVNASQAPGYDRGLVASLRAVSDHARKR
jgi:hypothetical protein